MSSPGGGVKATVWQLAHQYKLLMWKNFLLLRRSPLRILVELFWPLALFLILMAVRSRQSLVTRKPECHFHNKPMPSAGMLPFFQGIICLSNNTCSEHEVTDELSGQLTGFETTRVEGLVNDTANFLANDTQRNVLLNAVQEGQKIATALDKVQRNRESVGQLLGVNESSFYNTLQSEGVPLSNRTVDLLLNNVTVNPSALLDELFRIQDRNPRFIPKLEDLLTSPLDFQSLLTNESDLWTRAFSQDFAASISNISNITLPTDELSARLGQLNFSGIDTTDLLSQIRNARSSDEVNDILGGAADSVGLGDQLQNALDLNSSQSEIVSSYCKKEENKDSSACLLLDLLTNNSTSARVQDLREMCSQPRYSGLVTCMLWDVATSRDIATASKTAGVLCQHDVISDTSLCNLVNATQTLIEILQSVDPREVLCWDNTTILVYNSQAVEDEVKPAVCGMNETDLRILLTTLGEHVNVTAVRELYFPDGFNPELIFEFVRQLNELREMPSVQDMMADIQDIIKEGFGVSFCGQAADVPVMSPLAALQAYGGGNSTTSDNSSDFSFDFSHDPNANATTPPTLEEIEDQIYKDAIAQSEYQNHNSTTWQHYKRCRGLFRRVTDAQGELGDFMYRQMEPILFGKIPYSPSSPKVTKTIQRANETFKALATIKEAANDIRSNYTYWKFRLNRLGEELTYVDRILNLSIQGRRDDNDVTPQAFLERMLLSAADSGLPVDRSQLPNNLTDAVQQLLNLSKSLEQGGQIWNALDQLGATSDIIYQYLDCVELDKFEPFTSEYKLENRSVDLIRDGRFWAAIVFEDKLVDKNELPSHVSYKIRMNTDKVDGTEKIEDKYWRPRPRGRPPSDTKYITFGFAYLQDMIEHSLMGLMSNQSDKVGIYLQQFPYPCYNVDHFVQGISRTLPLFMVLSWIFSVALLVKSIVYEKQERLREQMKIMGLTNGIQWVAWYTVSVILIAPSILFLCLIFKYGKVLQAADPSVMALLLFAFSFSTTGQAFMFSVFFTKANLAACCGAIFYFALYLPYAIVNQYEEQMTSWMKGISCLLSPVAFGLGTTYVARYEEQGVGIQWSNINKSPLPGDEYSLLKCIGMMFLDGLLYWIIAWYKEHAFPGTYGIPKPFYFPFTKSFWCGTAKEASSQQQMSNRSGSYNVNQSNNASELTDQSANCEAEPTHLKLGVQLKGLTKVYSTGKKLAVDGLSLNLYEDQITSFLGHNGAGKTTTMSILCGLFPPSEGTAVVYDHDIRHELDVVRQSMGFCPQFNVLYEKLTVSEHIMFYGQLKGLTHAEAEAEMMTMLHATGMMPKIDAQTKALSGGMKRKLSVMCAFVGGSKCVVLDEPTAGVDPYSRRQIWELLLKFKQGRTILLSTHHMDEADFLGDRIAIISHGKLCCVGTSLYLKALHGNGYYLTLVRTEELEASSSLEQDIEKFVLSRVSGAVLMESVGLEMVFQLPSSEVKTGAFVSLFNDLDANLRKLELASYGICDTTLEEVFLKIADETGVDTDALLTDGGNLAMPISRESMRLKNGARRAFGKIKEKLAKIKATAKNYRKQNDDEDAASISPQQLHMADVDPDVQNAANSQMTENVINLTDGQGTDDGLTEDEDSTDIAAGGQLSIHYSNGQVSSNMNQSDDGELAANKLQGWQLILHQMKALLTKRFHHIRRDKVAFFCEIVLPATFILLAMAFSLAVPPVHPEPPLELQPWMYEPDRTDSHLNFFFRNEYPASNFTQDLEKLITEGQYGTRCMNPNIYQINDKPCMDASTSGGSMPKFTSHSSDIFPECHCSTGYQQCGAIPEMPSNATLLTNDYALNMTGKDVSKWIVKTMEPYIKQRYGGFGLDVGGSSASVNETDLLAIMEAALPGVSNIGQAADIAEAIEDLLDTVNIHQNIKVWFNNKGWTSSVSYMNAANNLLLRSKVKQDGKGNYKDYGITAINHPMNRTDYQFQKKVAEQGYVTLLISLCVIFAMSLIPATFVLYLIMDRVSTSKNLQFVSGMNRMVYWVTHFIWDMFNYIICASLCFLIFLAFNQKAFVSATNGPCLALLMVLYGWAMIPLMYPFSYLFKESSMAYVVLGCLNIFLGIVSTVSTFILESFPEEEELTLISKQMKKAFLILPHYCLGRGLIDMSVEHLKKEVAELLRTTHDYNPFALEIVGKNMVAMFVQGCVFFFLVIMIEYNFFYRPKPSAKPKKVGEMEEDVLAEETVIHEGNRTTDVLRTKNLTKLFKGHRAVNGLNFGVPAGQCFGLLGVNGAGKTTTFRMLTGIMSASGGDAYMLDHSITQEPTKVQENIGYCPQFDAIDPLVTVKEHLEYYARIRGVASACVKAVAMKKLRKMGLIKYQNKRAGDLSGGNKRKLQAAIALIGNPAIIFLDEPTTGMDPKARRFLWDSIIKMTKEGHAVVLTSHSMEECEVLCNRLAIMVNGTFRCLGTPQHLKNKYGEGYHVTIRIGGETNPDIGQLLNCMDSMFHSSALLLESSVYMAQYHISSTIAVAEIFSKLEGIRDRCMVEDYSVTQTSLDHVFIRFAKQQTDGLDSSGPELSLYGDSVSLSSASTATNSQLNLIV